MGPARAERQRRGGRYRSVHVFPRLCIFHTTRTAHQLSLLSPAHGAARTLHSFIIHAHPALARARSCSPPLTAVRRRHVPRLQGRSGSMVLFEHLLPQGGVTAVATARKSSLTQTERSLESAASHAHRHAHTHSDRTDKCFAGKYGEVRKSRLHFARGSMPTSSRSRCSPVRMYRRPCRHRRAPGDGADVVYGSRILPGGRCSEAQHPVHHPKLWWPAVTWSLNGLDASARSTLRHCYHPNRR